MNMATFKKKLLGGVERIFRDGKAIVEPEEIEALPAAVRRLDVGDSIEFDEVAPLPPEMPIPTPQTEPVKMPESIPHISVLSGEPATCRRYLNGEEYWLTEEEYATHNLGKLAQALREKSETVAPKAD